jgi:site-specific DNA-methyltransferase (adenine-specific)
LKKEFRTNEIYWGDCLVVLSSFPESLVDFIYLDPPFFSGKEYEIKSKNKQEQGFDDRWKGGIHEYVSWMKERLIQCHRVLKESGSMYVHCNWYANAHLRILLDEIFDHEIRCEVVWDKGFRGTERHRNWQQSHDTILFYTKTDCYTWNEQFQEYADRDMKRYNKVDSRNRKFALIKRRRGDGSVYYGKTYPKSKGKRMNDIIRVPVLSATSRERLNYPTQKPERLLQILVEASTNFGDLVLDPFCGSGTTLAAAEHLGRKWIGIDVSRSACEIALSRMLRPIDALILPTYT